MTVKTPRVRMFAGPNGSGKSTMIGGLDSRLSKLFLNADNLERDLKENPILDLTQFNTNIDPHAIIGSLKEATIPKQNDDGTKTKVPFLVTEPVIDGTTINFSGNPINSYLASLIIEAVRFELVRLKVSFTFETVMSHESKIDFLRFAKDNGYRTYLYFVTTEDPVVNVNRVRIRVSEGGHPVDEIKIRQRYSRTMNLLLDAIEVSDRAFLFDNSTETSDHNITYICEVTDGADLTFNPEFDGVLPIWFETHVLVHLDNEAE